MIFVLAVLPQTATEVDNSSFIIVIDTTTTTTATQQKKKQKQRQSGDTNTTNQATTNSTLVPAPLGETDVIMDKFAKNAVRHQVVVCANKKQHELRDPLWMEK